MEKHATINKPMNLDGYRAKRGESCTVIGNPFASGMGRSLIRIRFANGRILQVYEDDLNYETDHQSEQLP